MNLDSRIGSERLRASAIVLLFLSSWMLVPLLWAERNPLSSVVQDGWNLAWLWSTVSPGIPAVLTLCAGVAAMRSKSMLKAAAAVVGVYVVLCVWVVLDGRTAPTAAHLAGWVALALACVVLALGFRAASAPTDDEPLRSWTTSALVAALVGQIGVFAVPAMVDSAGSSGQALLSALLAASTALLASFAAWLIGRGRRHDLLTAAALVAAAAIAALVNTMSVGAASSFSDSILTVARPTLLAGAALLAIASARTARRARASID